MNKQQGNENELKQWVGSKGPVVIGFHVTNSSAFYESGVYTSSECGNKIDVRLYYTLLQVEPLTYHIVSATIRF